MVCFDRELAILHNKISLNVLSTVKVKLTRNVNVDRMMAEGHQVCRQRSQSLAGPLSRSADWTEELERRLRSREEDGGGSGGFGEYLVGYRGGGSQPICATRRSSCGQVTCSFQDVFTGEYRMVSVSILSMITVFWVQECKKLNVIQVH